MPSGRMPLLEQPLNGLLREILRKMQPASLSMLRETSLPLDIFLMKEAKRKNQKAEGARMVFAENGGVQIYKDVEGFLSTSLTYRPCVEDYIEDALEYWEDRISKLSAGTAIAHLAGSEISSAIAENLQCAESTIDLMDHFDIGVADLTMISCSAKATSQMLSHFQPTSFSVESCDFKGDGKLVEEIIVEQISKDLDEIRVVSDDEYPAAIVEAYLKSFKKGDSGLQRLIIQFPENKLPKDLFIGMKFQLVNNFQQRFSLLIRSDRASSRHILLRADFEHGTFIMDFTRIYDADELLFKMFGSFYEVCPDMPIQGISDLTPSELRSIFESQW